MDTLDIILFIAIVAAVAVIATMLSQNAGKMRQITSLKDEISHRDEEKQIMQKAIAERDAAIAASQATIAMLENQASAGIRSTKPNGQICRTDRIAK